MPCTVHGPGDGATVCSVELMLELGETDPMQKKQMNTEYAQGACKQRPAHSEGRCLQASGVTFQADRA